jgi:hypothetical protein
MDLMFDVSSIYGSVSNSRIVDSSIPMRNESSLRMSIAMFMRVRTP